MNLPDLRQLAEPRDALRAVVRRGLELDGRPSDEADVLEECHRRGLDCVSRESREGREFFMETILREMAEMDRQRRQEHHEVMQRLDDCCGDGVPPPDLAPCPGGDPPSGGRAQPPCDYTPPPDQAPCPGGDPPDGGLAEPPCDGPPSRPRDPGASLRAAALAALATTRGDARHGGPGFEFCDARGRLCGL